MKVRCTHLLDSRGKSLDKSAWLTLGKSYTVLAIAQGSDQKWFLRLIGDEPNGLAMFRLEQFEIVSSKIPETWIIKWSKDGFLELAPEPWCEAGFWERYYDHEPDALRTFEVEKGKITEAARKIRQSELLMEIVNKHCPKLLASVLSVDVDRLNKEERRIILEALGSEFAASGLGKNFQLTTRGVEIEELLNIFNDPNLKE